MSAKIFISYRRDDSKAITDRIYAWLKEQFGSNAVFYDIDSIGAGADWRDHIQKEVGRARVVLAIMSENWLPILQARASDEKDVLRFELETAFAKGIDVVPVLIERTPMPAASDLPSTLARLPKLNAAAVHEAKYFFHDMETLGERLVTGWGFERVTATRAVLKAAAPTSNLIVPSGYIGPRQPPPRADEQWETIALPEIAQKQWANGPGGIDRHPSKAVWAKSRPSGRADLYIRSRSHVVEMTLPSGGVSDFQTEPDPATKLEFVAILLGLGPETILAGTSGVCAGPNSSFLVSDGRKIMKFARGHEVVAEVSDEFHWDKMVYRFSQYAERKAALVHLNGHGLTFFDISSRPYRVQSTVNVSRDSEADLLWSPSLKRLASHHGYNAPNTIILSQSEDGTFSAQAIETVVDGVGFGDLNAIAWHPSKDILAFTGWDRDLNCALLAAFDFNSGKQLFKKRLKHTNGADCLDWSATGQHIATASSDGSIVIWDLESDLDVSLFDQRGGVARIEFSPDGQRLATFGPAGVIIYDPGTGQKTASWAGSASRSSFGESVWSPCASMIVSSNGGLEVRRLLT